MGFGKRVCEILAVIGAIVLIGILVWYLSSGMRDKGYCLGKAWDWKSPGMTGKPHILLL